MISGIPARVELAHLLTSELQDMGNDRGSVWRATCGRSESSQTVLPRHPIEEAKVTKEAMEEKPGLSETSEEVHS